MGTGKLCVRYLLFKFPLIWFLPYQMVAGIGLPVELKDQSITLGAVVKSYYELPNNSTAYTRPTVTLARKKRNPTRWLLYESIINFLERYYLINIL